MQIWGLLPACGRPGAAVVGQARVQVAEAAEGLHREELVPAPVLVLGQLVAA